MSERYEEIFTEYRIPRLCSHCLDEREELDRQRWDYVDTVGFGVFPHPNGGFTTKSASVECGVNSVWPPKELSRWFNEVYHMPDEDSLRIWKSEKESWFVLDSKS